MVVATVAALATDATSATTTAASAAATTTTTATSTAVRWSIATITFKVVSLLKTHYDDLPTRSHVLADSGQLLQTRRNLLMRLHHYAYEFTRMTRILLREKCKCIACKIVRLQRENC